MYALLPISGILIFLGNAVALFLGLPVAVSAETQPSSDPASLAGLILLPISGVIFFIIYPYFVFRQQGYFHGNLAYGDVYSRFTGIVSPYRKLYLHATFIGAMSILVMTIIGSIFMPTMTDILASVGQGASESYNPEKLAFFGFYFIAMIIFIIINQYLYAKKHNYSWGQTHLGEISFNFSLEASDLIWIRLTNLLAILMSLGLLIPWARIRRARYIFSHINVSLPSNMESIRAISMSEEDVLGDTAADFFDWDIGW